MNIFVRSGHVALNTGAMRNFGVNGYDWSRIATVYGAGTWDAKAYYLDFNASGVYPSNAYVRWVGFPVRCLVYKLTERSKYLRSRSSGRTNCPLGRSQP